MLDFGPVSPRNCLTDFAMSTYTLALDEGSTKVNYSFSTVYCPDVIEHVKQFLLAAGFSERCIADSFDKSAQETFDYLKDLANNSSQFD
jgi:chaperonin GroEL (HSP60 family)